MFPTYNFAMCPTIKVKTEPYPAALPPPENLDLPRQTWMLQVLLCRLTLIQGGMLQLRERCCCPPPQLTEQVDHCDQGSQGPTESGTQIIYHSVSVVTLTWCGVVVNRIFQMAYFTEIMQTIYGKWCLCDNVNEPFSVKLELVAHSHQPHIIYIYLIPHTIFPQKKI